MQPWAVILFWAALLFALVMALLPNPPQITADWSDKWQHALAFAVLTALSLVAFPRLSVISLAVRLAAFGAFIEGAQMLPALGREGSMADWFADCAAIAAVLLVLGPVLRRGGTA